jgi:hypothetical protein
MGVAEASFQIFNLLALLAMGHCVADDPLQTDRIALEKCPGCSSSLDWPWWLLAHAGVHAFSVERIDLGKCRRRDNLAVDQGLHLLCRLFWAVLAVLVLN